LDVSGAEALSLVETRGKVTLGERRTSETGGLAPADRLRGYPASGPYEMLPTPCFFPTAVDKMHLFGLFVESSSLGNSLSSENTLSRYVVGFDLGTTNSAVTYVDSSEEPWQVRVFAVPQLVAAGQVEARETVPSFHYQPGPGELPPAALRLPWTTAKSDEPPHVVGFFARDHGPWCRGG